MPSPRPWKLEDTPHGLGVLPRMAALSKKSSLQQVLQEKAESAWGTCSGDKKKKDFQHSFTNKVILKCWNKKRKGLYVKLAQTNVTIEQKPICLVLWPPALHTQQTETQHQRTRPALCPKSQLARANLAEAELQSNFEEKQLASFRDREEGMLLSKNCHDFYPCVSKPKPGSTRGPEASGMT